jgi:hypothetical protein
METLYKTKNIIQLGIRIKSSSFSRPQMIFYAVKDQYLKVYCGAPMQAVKRFGGHRHPGWQRGDDDGLI